MNRPIKFRVWCHHGTRMIDDFYMRSSDCYDTAPWDHHADPEWLAKYENLRYEYCFFSLNDAFNENMHKRRIVFMQFTGLLDKNKKEIYEGDILYEEGAYGGGEEYCVVKFERGAFLVNRTDLDRVRGDGWSELWLWNEYVEVVGNVWENPELKEKCRE